MTKRRSDIPRMTVQEFLAYDDGTDMRYELVDGQPVAMAPARAIHARIAQNVGFKIDTFLGGREPCRALQAPGVMVDAEADTLYIPDVVMTCEDPSADSVTISEPRLVVEILSPSTKHYDLFHKVPDYAALPSVNEVWLVSSESRSVMVWRREAAGWTSGLPYVGTQGFASPALGGEVALDRLYRLTGL